jgi:hypothetical protein
MPMNIEETAFTHEECTRFMMEKINSARLASRIVRLPLVVFPLTEANIKIILEDLKAKGFIKRYSTVIKQFTKAPHLKDDKNSYYILTLNETFDSCLNELRNAVPLIVFVTKDTYKPKQKALIVEGIKVPISKSGKEIKQTQLLGLLFKSNLHLQKGISLDMFSREVQRERYPTIEDSHNKARSMAVAINKKITKVPALSHVTDLLEANRDGIFINKKYRFTPV